MISTHNDYFPYTIAPLGTVDVVVEAIATMLPLQHASVLVRNIDNTNPLTVTWRHELVVDAPMNFAGTWESDILTDGVLDPEGLLVLSPVQSILDGAYSRHRLILTNPSASATVLVHVLLNGMVEAASAAPAQTYVVNP